MLWPICLSLGVDGLLCVMYQSCSNMSDSAFRDAMSTSESSRETNVFDASVASSVGFSH